MPVENTLGPEGGGVFVILSNFNHERWMIMSMSLSTQRRMIEECLLWASQRRVFGKPLSAQPVVRSRIAQMIARVEGAQAWLEGLTYQMNNVRASLPPTRPVLTPLRR